MSLSGELDSHANELASLAGKRFEEEVVGHFDHAPTELVSVEQREKE